jgi:predicted DNA-binding transcriptional regulator AlpA
MTNKNSKPYLANLIPGSETHGLLRLPPVLQLVGFGKSLLWAEVRKRNFPKQIKLGPKTSVWSREAVDKWIKEQVEKNNYTLKEKLYSELIKRWDLIPGKINLNKNTYIGNDNELVVTPIDALVAFSVYNANTGGGFTVSLMSEIEERRKLH